ncbi:rho guanine nucleotide exchange factor 38 [Sorex araneus]|uniref:rho guanine nucleotide exchange factor 38 n=1 Tax=Sorex araneus TaxID=42254 RepID=UPI002433C180|nr:rho guanine nucleotide exchange factor 38 [Sorex araneus]
MEPREAAGKEGPGARRKNLHFLRLYMLERRKTDTVLEGSAPGERGGPLRRTQSDRSEYSQKLQEKMTPQAGCCAARTPARDEEQQTQRMMAKRAKVIAELIQTEQDYVRDLELCVSHVVQPLRSQQIDGLDVDSLFSNIESVLQVSARLLALLEEATAGVEPDAQVIGDVFLQLRGPLEDTYKVYCYQHDEAQGVLEAYEREELLKRHLGPCLQALKKIYTQEGRPNLLDMGSLMIRPIQRVMKYPLLLCELRNATPASHPDSAALQDACAAVRDINVNINELKRRKDLVLKYKKSDEDESLKDKLSRLNIHSISKKSKRVTNHLMLLTRGEAQVRDGTFDREEKLFRALEKTVRHCVKNTACWLQLVQEAVPLALQTVTELQEVSCGTEEEGQGPSEAPRRAPGPGDDFAGQCQRLVLAPLSALLALFPGPQKLIQKRYDKLLDHTSSRPRAAGEQPDLARREYEALNAQLVEELRVFNRAARAVLLSCLQSLLRELARLARSAHAAWLPEPPSASSSFETQTRVLEEVQNLNFVKDNSATFIERKLSFEKKKPVPTLPEGPRQTDAHRAKLLSTYSLEELYQAKRKCHASQECDLSLLEGDVVAVLEQKDPLGSAGRWLVDTGAARGYVYSSFLKPYNPAKGRRAAADSSFTDDDFENISLFVSSRPAGACATDAPEGSASDSSSSLSGTSGRGDANGTDADSLQEVEEQVFYAVHAFQARSDHELSLQEYQRVHILRFCDLSGNKEWWLAEAQGHRGYVPANYLGKMTYA